MNIRTQIKAATRALLRPHGARPLLAALCAGFIGLALPLAALAEELRGHGGPVRAIALSADGTVAMTGSFDQSAIRWDLANGAARDVLRTHEGSVNAVIALPDGRFATGGEDGRIVLWGREGREPLQVIPAHRGPIAALALSADGTAILSAAWDETVRLTRLSDLSHEEFTGHSGPVNGVAGLRGGRIVSAGYDATLRIWEPGERTGKGAAKGQIETLTLTAPLNALVVAPDSELAVAGGDGRLRIVKPTGDVTAEIEIGPTPLIALALSPDGRFIAAGGLRGQVAIVERASRTVVARLVGPGLPVWSLAFTPDGREILSGGADRLVRRWDARTGAHIGSVVPQRGEDVLAAFRGERGAEVFRACAACHTLTPDDGNRAGPTLHGIFGRRIASLPGYDFSPALRGMDIVWTPETVSRLFEIGPNAYTPGTKMPEQTITSAADREALMRFLEKTTAPR
jgi:cytochrome c